MATTTGFQKSQTEGRGDQGQNPGQNPMDKAKDMGASAMDKGKEMAGNAADKARDVASNLGRKAEDATHAVGSGMQSLASTMRDNLPREGVLGNAASTVVGGLESTGRYLEREGLQGIGEDLTSLIRRNPVPAILVGIGLGFLLARVTTPSRS